MKIKNIEALREEIKKTSKKIVDNKIESIKRTDVVSTLKNLLKNVLDNMIYANSPGNYDRTFATRDAVFAKYIKNKRGQKISIAVGVDEKKQSELHTFYRLNKSSKYKVTKAGLRRNKALKLVKPYAVYFAHSDNNNANPRYRPLPEGYIQKMQKELTKQFFKRLNL